MIQGGSGVVSCDCENLEFFLNLCLVLKQYQFHYYFCNYHSFIILENIMENTGTVCTQVADCSLQPQENFLLGRREWPTKDNVIIVGKVGIWPMCALLNK